LIGPSFKKIETLEAPQNARFYLNHRVPSLWPNYIGERRPTFAKTYGRKMRCYWELFGEHVRNLGANFDLTPSPKKLAWKVNCPLSKWKVNNGQSILHT
jgi:hypothetical protein